MHLIAMDDMIPFHFDESLCLESEIKDVIQSTILREISDEITPFAIGVSPFSFTAEKKTRPDGSGYVLVRKATAQEKWRLYGKK